MRYAILSDIHANAAALRAVLVDAQDCGATQIICLGDVLGYGPDPVPALEEVYARVPVCLAGNHDDAVCGRCSADDFNAFAASAVARHRAALAPQALAWLRQLPYVWAGPGFACTHGDFSDPAAFYYIQEPSDAEASFAARPEALLFVGHTHQPGVIARAPDGACTVCEPADFRLASGYRYIVNVGSVGYPRSGICRSHYCIYDDSAGMVYFRSLPFDLESYRARMGGKGLDEAPWLAARAAQRAVPQVRATAHFGQPARTKPVAKVPWRRVFAVGIVLALAVAGIAGAQAVSRRKHPVRTAAPAVRAVAPARSPRVAPAAARPAPTLPPEIVVTNRMCALAAGDKVYFAVKLAPKSHPVQVRLVFRGADGAVLAGTAITYPPVAATLSRGTARTAVKPPDAARAVELVAVKAAGVVGYCQCVRFDLDNHPLEKGKRK